MKDNFRWFEPTAECERMLWKAVKRPRRARKQQLATSVGMTGHAEGSWANFQMPVILQHPPALVTEDIVSVQPLTAPGGSIFHLDICNGANAERNTRRRLRRLLQPGERLYRWSTLGVLSGRAGWFIARGRKISRYTTTELA